MPKQSRNEDKQAKPKRSATAVKPSAARRSAKPSGPSNSIMNNTDENPVLDRERDYVPAPEPAATAIALAESREGEGLYRDIKGMEMEAQGNPDPEDALLEIPPDDEIGALPI